MMRRSDSGLVRLRLQPLLVIVNRAIKVFNATIIAHPQRRAHSSESADVVGDDL